MYRLTLTLKIEHAEGGDGYEHVKFVEDIALLGDDNHPGMANTLQGMIRRLFTRLKEVPEKPKILKPGLVAPTEKQMKQINRRFDA